ncbi:uncharacterized protein LOC110981291 [Acanthaster planci]|uniref:Uncharacterized protein LOC110981291 n=1 Tax=Acanthaster planci TaxID=133434 RepID=A0A8B7YP54_ACAPL|nr:uncharacterized protein LOC110981291 [Acanthaster planci]
MHCITMWSGLIIRASLVVLSWFTVSLRAATPSCGGSFSRSVPLTCLSPNLALSNHLLKSYTKRSPVVCVAACIKEDRCVSVNYEGVGGICELNESSKDAHPADMEIRDGWRHYGTLPGTVPTKEICPIISTKSPETTMDTTTTPSTTTQSTTSQPTTTQVTSLQPSTTRTTTIQPTTTQPTTTQTTTFIPTTALITTEKPPLDCWDIHATSPELSSGEYTVYPTTRAGSLQVYCDMDTDGGGWTVFQRRVSNSQDFYQNWAAYKAGFGDLSTNFWLGNDALHELTAQRDYELRIELQSFSAISTYAKYGLFQVADEADKYRLNLGNFYGSYTADDSLTYHNGMSFSTLDQDNDVDLSRHCAQSFRGAWWYQNCFASNLNGPFINTESVSQKGQGIIWGAWLTIYNSLKFAEMKLRPVSAQSGPKDCWDHYTQGQTVSGLYNIHVTGKVEALQVYCDMDDVGGGWTVIQRRVDGSGDFYLDWADYKAGFGDHSSEFWFGNDNLHLLTNQASYQLTVKLERWNSVIKYANYEQFSIANETDLYRLSVSGFFGSSGIGDSMNYHNGMVWSTRDRDNDNDEVRHCAQNKEGAWWYDACETCNLNGPYVPYPGTLSIETRGRGIVWGTWLFQEYSFPKAEMKVRPTHVGFSL